MVSAHTARQIHRTRKQALRTRQNPGGQPFKGIFHPDHLPATVGMFGFIVAFSLFSLQLALTPFMPVTRQLQQLPVEAYPVSESETDVDDPSDYLDTELNDDYSVTQPEMDSYYSRESLEYEICGGPDGIRCAQDQSLYCDYGLEEDMVIPADATGICKKEATIYQE